MIRMGRSLLYSIVLSACFMALIAQAHEYIYPVASVMRDGKNYLYFIHQISLTHLQLLQWDAQTKAITPALGSSITPAGIKILPDNTGFSFIDQGSLYIKYFSKRSPVKIDMHELINQMDIIEWIDSATCYFTASNNKQFAIYQLSTIGTLDIIIKSDYADCLYPQKIDSELYYIERSFGKKNYSIKRVEYRVHSHEYTIDVDSTLIHDNHDHPIAFLRMINRTHGFYVSYPGSIESQASYLACAYHQITYDYATAVWITKKLFEFSIPLDFILPDSQDRLHESLLPLLPRHTEDGIYYCDCTTDATPQKKQLRNLGGRWYDAGYVKIYFYDFSTQKTALKTDDCYRDHIAPLPIHNGTFYGYSMNQNSKNTELLMGMRRNEYGQICYEPPKI